MKRIRNITLIICAMIMIFSLTACGKTKSPKIVTNPVSFDGLQKITEQVGSRTKASSYLKLWLDANYHQEYSEYAKYLGKGEESLKAEMREKELQVVEETILGSDGFAGAADSQKEELLNAINEVYQSAKYQIGLGRQNEDGSYSVPLTVYPIKTLEALNNNFEQEALGRFSYVPSDEEWIGFTIEMLRKYNAEAGFGDPVTLEIPLEAGLGGAAFYLGEAEANKIEAAILPVD